MEKRNIATDEGEVDYWKSEVDYWKSEVIAFVVELCFLIFLRCRSQGEGQGLKQTFE
jgi:hypothetical protein